MVVIFMIMTMMVIINTSMKTMMSMKTKPYDYEDDTDHDNDHKNDNYDHLKIGVYNRIDDRLPAYLSWWLCPEASQDGSNWQPHVPSTTFCPQGPRHLKTTPSCFKRTIGQMGRMQSHWGHI